MDSSTQFSYYKIVRLVGLSRAARARHVQPLLAADSGQLKSNAEAGMTARKSHMNNPGGSGHGGEQYNGGKSFGSFRDVQNGTKTVGQHHNPLH